MKEIRDRIVGEVMLEELFFSPFCRNYYFMDYADLRYVRRDNTLQVTYSERLNMDNKEEFYDWQKKVGEILDNVSCIKCIVQICESINEKGGFSFCYYAQGIDEVISRTIKHKRFMPYMSNKFKGMNILSIAVYIFSEKKEEDSIMDKKIEEILGICHEIRSASVGTFEFPECNADARLGAYARLLSFLSVDNDSAEYIKELIEDVLQLVEDDLKKGHKIEISTLQDFVFVSENQWKHLASYFQGPELEKTPQKWERILRKLRGEDTLY